MKKTTIILATILAVSFASPANAAYKNCTDINKDYKFGVAQSDTAKNLKKSGKKIVEVKSKGNPFVDAVIYNTLKKLDRDSDGIICEK